MAQKHVDWGVQWQQQPAFIALCASLGLLLAVGHHIFYLRLNNTLAGTQGRQQFAHAFGNVLAISVATLFAFTCRAAYKQYFWTVVRRKSFTIGGLDSLYSLTSDVLGLSNLEVWGQAPLAALLVLACWAMTLVAFLPPGSLTVASDILAESYEMSIPQLNWNLPSWVDINIPGLPAAANVADLVTQSSEEMRVLDFEAPAPNSSHSMEIRGPFLQCEPPNSSQIPVFEYYRNMLYQDPINVAMVTQETLPIALQLFNTTSLLHTSNAVDPPSVPGCPDLHGLVMSAFDPLLGEGLSDFDFVGGNIVQSLGSGIWDVNLPVNFGESMGYTPSICQPVAANATQPGDTPACQMFPLQLWITTSNDQFICTLGNGTRTGYFNFSAGIQTVSYSELRDFQPVFAPRQITLSVPDGNITQKVDVDYQVHSYLAVYIALQNMLNGNLTMWLPWTSPTPPFLTDLNLLLRTGLDACDEIKNNIWSQNYTNNLFDNPDYTCRNRSLPRAIEDLAANVTISLLTSSDLTTPNATTAQVTTLSRRNVYIYTPLTLLLSYGIAFLVTIPCAALGLYAFHVNGVAHSHAFSAIVATTRNPVLDIIAEGNAFGTVPLEKEASRARWKFGRIGNAKTGERVAFGLVDEVRPLKKGLRTSVWM